MIHLPSDANPDVPLCRRPRSTVTGITTVPGEVTCVSCWETLPSPERVPAPSDDRGAGRSGDPTDPPRSTGGRWYCSACGTTGRHWASCPRVALAPDRDSHGQPV